MYYTYNRCFSWYSTPAIICVLRNRCTRLLFRPTVPPPVVIRIYINIYIRARVYVCVFIYIVNFTATVLYIINIFSPRCGLNGGMAATARTHTMELPVLPSISQAPS